jgi:hypothetical protein
MDVASTPSSSNPRCTKCHGILDSNLDMTRTTSRYYKNCYRCREKKTASNRRRRPGLFPQFSPIAAESRSPGSREAIAPVASVPDRASQTAIAPASERPRSPDPWSIYLETYNRRMRFVREDLARSGAAQVFIEAVRREARLDAERRGLDPNTANEVIYLVVRAARQHISREENRHRAAMDARRAEERRRERNRTTVPVIHTPTNYTPTRAAPVNLFSRIPAERQTQASTLTSRHDSYRTRYSVIVRPAVKPGLPRNGHAASSMSATNEMATHGGFTNTIYGSISPDPAPTDHTPTDPAPTDPAPTATSPTHAPDHVPSNQTSTLECSVCSDEFSPEEFPRLGACSHEPRVCQECLLGWLNQRMASTTWEQIQCPSSGCTNAISHDDVKRYAPLETFIRYAPST